MVIAHVPRLRAAPDHGAVVQLGVLRDKGVLLRVEVGLTAILHVLRSAATQRAQYRDRLVLARRGDEICRASIFLLVLPIGLEASIGASRAGGETRIDALEVLDYGTH